MGGFLWSQIGASNAFPSASSLASLAAECQTFIPQSIHSGAHLPSWKLCPPLNIPKCTFFVHCNFEKDLFTFFQISTYCHTTNFLWAKAKNTESLYTPLTFLARNHNVHFLIYASQLCRSALIKTSLLKVSSLQYPVRSRIMSIVGSLL